MNYSLHPSLTPSLSDYLTDLLCLVSIVGIWPRFIETKWLDINQLQIPLPHLPSSFEGFRIAHISDLHLNSHTPFSLLKSLSRALQKAQPDLIAFTGDFICYASIEKSSALLDILRSWSALAPTIACPGNHDYKQYVTQKKGATEIRSQPSSFLLRGLKKLLIQRQLPQATAYQHQSSQIQLELHELCCQAGILLLQDESYTLESLGQTLTFYGVDDLWAAGAQKLASQLKKGASHSPCPIILSHNPDSIDLMANLPSSLVLSGHTHGGNINLPWISKRLCTVRDPHRQQGLHRVGQHLLHISRGLGNPYPLRLFARPQLSLLQLISAPPYKA